MVLEMGFKGHRGDGACAYHSGNRTTSITLRLEVIIAAFGNGCSGPANVCGTGGGLEKERLGEQLAAILNEELLRDMATDDVMGRIKGAKQRK